VSRRGCSASRFPESRLTRSRPTDYRDAAIRALIAAGETFGIRPYGTEAMAILRVEKGHPAGDEPNGQTTARALGLERMMSRRKDYTARVLAQRPAVLAPDRPSQVGLRPVDRTRRLRAGTNFIPFGAAVTIAHDRGWLSSAAYSPALGHWIGLGFLASRIAWAGDHVRAVDPFMKLRA
jgi:glycine cleavage system aminomethyltransferase T